MNCHIIAASWLSSSHVIWLAISFALILLIAGLFVAVRKGWLDASTLTKHPFAKYVVLSVFAHLALAVWLYTSHVLDAPSLGSGNNPSAMVVELIDDNAMDENSNMRNSVADMLTPPKVVAPTAEAPALAERTADPQEPIERPQTFESEANDAKSALQNFESLAAESIPNPETASNPFWRTENMTPSPPASISASNSPSQEPDAQPTAIAKIKNGSAKAAQQSDDAVRQRTEPVATATKQTKRPDPANPIPARTVPKLPAKQAEPSVRMPVASVRPSDQIPKQFPRTRVDDEQQLPKLLEPKVASLQGDLQEQTPRKQTNDLRTNQSRFSGKPIPSPQPPEQHLAQQPNQQRAIETLKNPPTSNPMQSVSSQSPSTRRAVESLIDDNRSKSSMLPTRSDGRAVPAIYRDRFSGDRLALARARGGDENTEAAARLALSWLAKAQSADGSWDASRYGSGQPVFEGGHDRRGAGIDADTGLTGLAVLAYLGAGHTHQSGEYKDVIADGLDFLLRAQAQHSDGSVVGNATKFARMYCHGMATLALSEAYSLTGDTQLKAPVRRAIDFTIDAQNPSSGGWRYGPLGTSVERGDTSQLGWQLMALTSAHYAKIPIPGQTWTRAGTYLNSVASGSYGGLAAYRPDERWRPSAAMTAEALLCRMFLRQTNSKLTGEAAGYLMQKLPGSGRVNYYYWYYGTLALFHLHDGHWTRWNSAVKRQLVSLQRRDGPLAGSWDTDSVWGGSGGRVYTTALGALTLEVYYRYRPLNESRQTEHTAWKPD